MADPNPIADARALAEQNEKMQSYFGSAQFRDSFQNFGLSLGVGTNNALSQSTYGFNPITRNRTLLEWIHRGSWLGGVAIDLVADDMTKAGIEITSTMPPDDIEELQNLARRLNLWPEINDTIKWGRLYGGAIAVMLIEGQDVSQPLRIETVGKNDFRGLTVLDRWMVEPSLTNLVKEFGPDLGMPEYYHVLALAPALTGQQVHYSRVLRMEGVRLPYAQRVMENMWSISVLERLYDRMIGFDSATQGLSQSIYKSYLRWLKIKGMRQIIYAGDDQLRGVINYVEMMRKFQGVEGVTMLDGEDDFGSVNQSNFTGMSDGLLQLGQQLAGALQIPLVRLFGMSPAGLNSTGESDLRMYYDGINSQQERHLHEPVNKIYKMMARSEGIAIPENFDFRFKTLWQLQEAEKAQISVQTTQAVSNALADGIINLAIAAEELREASRKTGVFSNITDEYIEELKSAPPPAPPGLEELGAFGGGPQHALPRPGEPAKRGEGQEATQLAPGQQQRSSASGERPRLRLVDHLEENWRNMDAERLNVA
jgi:phage-related protein (TIGR01555 family)